MSQLIVKRDALIAERDRLQKQIQDMWQESKDECLKQLVDAGLYKPKLQYHEAVGGCSLTSKFYLFVTNSYLLQEIHRIVKHFQQNSIELDNDIILTVFAGGGAQISFGRKSNPAEFIKKNKIEIDFSIIDEKIATLQKIKDSLNGW
jgi:hypothetical protein